MANQASDHQGFGEVLRDLIENLELPDIQRRVLVSRWLEQILWLEAAAARARRGYYGLRLTAIVGGVIVPALVSSNVAGTASAVVRWTAFSLSLVVAISAAVEEFFHFGERWRHYRRTAELLKSEGWQFFQKSGRYREFERYEDAYPMFAAQVEAISQQEVEVYVSQITQEKKGEKTPAD